MKSFVEVQGRFSDNGKFVSGTYVPQIVDSFMQEVYQHIGDAAGLSRLRITVEVEDLGAEIKYGGDTLDAPAKNADPSCATDGKLVNPAIIPVSEVVA